jgi:hypothetical protein
MYKLWPIVDGEDIIVGASSAPEEATEYLTWKEWVSLQGRGITRYSEIEHLMRNKTLEAKGEIK